MLQCCMQISLQCYISALMQVCMHTILQARKYTCKLSHFFASVQIIKTTS